jgi:hypothetical protein
LHGLECATNKRLYGLLKRQILFSVIARQAPDGGWYHGEWTDLMESHFRLHNAALAMLEAAFEERGDQVVQAALAKAAAFTSRRTDSTDLGLWFLHDSLEESAEMATVSGAPRWVLSRALGKSTTNKLILNTHLDAIVVLDRYREITGDNQYADHVASALIAVRALLKLRPAERLYRLLFWAIGLTLVPASEANKWPLALRVTRRLAAKYIAPQLHNVKRIFPRLVMPGGLIDRHLSPPYFTVGYHPVNVMDLARLWRRFPDEDLGGLLEEAIKAVTDSSLLRYWVEATQRQAVGYWVEALYHLCTLIPAHAYRGRLAEAILAAEDAGLGLPPSLLGANPEVVKQNQQAPCPSPADSRLRVANLSCGGGREVLVVNATTTELELEWQSDGALGLSWRAADGQRIPAGNSPLTVPPRGWLVGQECGSS